MILKQPQMLDATAKHQSSLSEGSTICSEALNIDRAEGVFMWDSTGKRYIDLFSQTWSMPLGHNNKAVIEAVRKQLGRITHLRTAYSTPEKVELAKKIIELSPKGITKVNFVLHGSLAVEGAIKLAINRYDNRDKILYLEDGFHGRSLATMGVSWKLPDSKYKSYFNNGIEVKKDLEDIEEKMKEHRPAGIILELIQGNSGCNILEKELVKGIRELCYKHDVTMIVDEVQTGFGCMGVNFLCSEYEVNPDIIVFGKAIGGGFPLAGTLYKEEYAFQPGDHSFTFAHNPVSLTAGLAYLNELQPNLKRAEILSPIISEFLNEVETNYPNLINARCLGLKGAIDVVDEYGLPDCKSADLIVSKLLEKGVIISNSRYKHLGNTLMLQPPLITTPKQLQEAFSSFDSVLSEIYGIKIAHKTNRPFARMFERMVRKRMDKMRSALHA
jgi:4-aminobutyrate aminotransferase/4-aminobutyrate aminotransferase/(S)-3-amino-2-methylpropionate transaminase